MNCIDPVFGHYGDDLCSGIDCWYSTVSRASSDIGVADLRDCHRLGSFQFEYEIYSLVTGGVLRLVGKSKT